MKIFSSTGQRIVLLFSLLTTSFLFIASDDLGVLESILKKMQRFHVERPQQKLYLHLDKPFYAAGENIWYKAYLVEASLHALDSQSRTVYVELIDKSKQVFKRKMIFVPDGTSFGDFQLPDTLEEGHYRIRAYTNYMKNAGEDFFFSKEFSVLNPFRKVPKDSAGGLSRDSISLTFFPEGGNLVACGFNRVAFHAIGPDGKSLAVEGTIIDENNTVIAHFKSQHVGMGSVRINPVAGKKYSAQITKPYAIARHYPLPIVHQKGYIMQVDDAAKNFKVVVLSNDGSSSDESIVSLVVQSRGKVYHALQGKLKGNAFFTNIAKSKLPDGISQITVFDAKGRPVAERLIYQDHHERIALSVKTDTTVYGKRKMVTAYIDSQYDKGSPVSGNFSISVYNDDLIRHQDEYPLTITNYLSLTSDLKGYIENPGYYFKDTLSETRKSLDLLMMVHGWRRFTWADVLRDTISPQLYLHERGVPVSGRVLKTAGKHPPTGSILKVLTMDGKAIRLLPDSLGKFYTDSLLYYDSMTLVFQTENLKGKKQPYKFNLNPPDLPPASTQNFTSFIPFNASAFITTKIEEKLFENPSNAKMLEGVKVTARRENDPRLLNSEGPGGRVVDPKDLNGGNGYQNVFQMLQTRVPGLIVSTAGNNVGIRIRGKAGNPIVLVNGAVTPMDAIMLLSPTDVDLMEVMFNSARYGGDVISITLKKGASVDVEPVGVNQIKTEGFYNAREFYSPNYEVKDDRHSQQDKRSTLFWEPVIITDENGRAGVAFFTGDVPARYRIVIEGITHAGYPGTATTFFEVK